MERGLLQLFSMRSIGLLLLGFVSGCAPIGVDRELAEKADDPGGVASRCTQFMSCVHDGRAPAECAAPLGSEPLCETPTQRSDRHQAIGELRSHDKIVIVHRGSWEFGHENSLEAFRASMELGAEGNEIDIRRTADGVLVMFHDDYVDRALYGVGALADLTWAELQQHPFRDPGAHGHFTRVATLAETLLLHREHPGLIHLDVKVAGIDDEISEFLDVLDMWDHIILANCNQSVAGQCNEARIRADSRYRPRERMVGLSVDRRDVDPVLVADAVARAEDGIFVDDPRATLLALGRELGAVSSEPVSTIPWTTRIPASGASIEELRARLADNTGWNELPADTARQAELAERIVQRAQAALELSALGADDASTLAALRERVEHRSMHKDWMVHGLDGQEALRALASVGATEAVSLARLVVFLDDPAVADIAFPGFPNAAVDWRMKGSVWDALEGLEGNAEAAQLCRDYLALSDQQAEALGFLNFEQAAESLLRVLPSRQNALGLLGHRRSDVKARAVLEMLKHLDETWAQQALEEGAPFALDYVAPSAQ